MSLEDKLQELLDIKQAIKTALEAKGIPMTNVAFTEYANKILEIGVVDEYYNYAKDYYTATNNATLFENAWQDMKEVDGAEIERVSTASTQYGTLQYPNGEDNGVIIPNSVTSIGYMAFRDWTSNNQPLVIPNSVTSIGDYAFRGWSSNTQPLVIPDSVTSIGNSAFYNWSANNQPLVIPNSVTSIGNSSFENWTSNNQPLVIPNSVTSIGMYAFRSWTKVPYIEMKSETPPTLANSNAFNNQNNAPIYVPDASVDDYKTATNWVDLASRIFAVSVKEYYNYSKDYYTATNNSTLFENAWQDMKDSETVLFDIPLALAAPNQDMGGIVVDLYVGTNGQLQELYDACVNETITPPISNYNRDVYYVNDVATFYAGDISGDSGFPIPLYNFGIFDADDSTSFLVTDLTPLSMGLGLVLAKIVNVSIPNKNIVIQQGFEFENENGIIIPDSVTSIGEYAFWDWTANNQPLVIPNSVTSIGDYAFRGWSSNTQPLVIPDSVTSIGNSAFYNWSANNQPLVIPNSVTSIGEYAFGDWTANNQPLVILNSVTSIDNYAFSYWTSNNQPLVIPDSVTSIGDSAFYSWNNVPYIEMKSATPPTLGSANAFYNQNNAPIYVPDESVEAYKTATNWVELASRIFPISDKV